MPKYSGFDVLTWLQSQPELAGIPVVVLTGSIYPEDRKRATELGAIGYEIKPVDANDLVAIANNIRLRFDDTPAGLAVPIAIELAIHDASDHMRQARFMNRLRASGISPTIKASW